MEDRSEEKMAPSKPLNEAEDARRAQMREDIRRSVLAGRAALPKPYRLHKSSAICEELTQSLRLTCAMLDIDPTDCVLAVYSAFEDEVQLEEFIAAAYDQGMQVAFPCIVTDAWGLADAPEQTMEMRRVDQAAYETGAVPFLANPLKKYRHDDPELEAYPYIEPDALTMIVIPLVAFDKKHNRLGYGGGNYDRYLPQVNDDCRQIAVAFAEQEVPAIPNEEHDIPVAVLAR